MSGHHRGELDLELLMLTFYKLEGRSHTLKASCQSKPFCSQIVMNRSLTRETWFAKFLRDYDQNQ